jgi:hypothetical protein
VNLLLAVVVRRNHSPLSEQFVQQLNNIAAICES